MANTKCLLHTSHFAALFTSFMVFIKQILWSSPLTGTEDTNHRELPKSARGHMFPKYWCRYIDYGTMITYSFPCACSSLDYFLLEGVSLVLWSMFWLGCLLLLLLYSYVEYFGNQPFVRCVLYKYLPPFCFLWCGSPFCFCDGFVMVPFEVQKVWWWKSEVYVHIEEYKCTPTTWYEHVNSIKPTMNGEGKLWDS